MLSDWTLGGRGGIWLPVQETVLSASETRFPRTETLISASVPPSLTVLFKQLTLKSQWSTL